MPNPPSTTIILISVKVKHARERAIEYMLEHTARSRDNIEREVNR